MRTECVATCVVAKIYRPFSFFRGLKHTLRLVTYCRLRYAHAHFRGRDAELEGREEGTAVGASGVVACREQCCVLNNYTPVTT